MLKDLINSIFHSSHERLRNPFVSSFIISTIILNWKAILILILSDLNIEARIFLVSKLYLTIYSCLIYPLCIALFYVIILPYLMQGIAILIKKAKTKQIENYFSEEILKTEQRALLVKSEVKLERIKANSKELSDLNETIEMLKKSNSEKDSLLKDMRKSYEELNIDYEKQMSNLIQVKNSNIPPGVRDEEYNNLKYDKEVYVLFKEIAEFTEVGRNSIYSKNRMKSSGALKFLMNNSIVKIVSQEESHLRLELTNKGVVYWKRMKQEGL